MISGILWACQFIVVNHNEDFLAEQLMRESGHSLKEFLAEQKKTGYETRRMNAVIREAFRRQ